MTPDEELLAKARALLDAGRFRQFVVIGDCTVIDSASLRGLAELSQVVRPLIALVERQQEMLVEVTAEKLYPFNMPNWDRLPEEDHKKIMFSGKVEEYRGKKSYRFEAKQQLAQEFPEIDWNE